MAFYKPSVNGRANDGDLPEASPYEGLEHHIPPVEQKQRYAPPNEEKEYHPGPTELPSDDFNANHPTASHPHAYSSWDRTQAEPNLPQTQNKRALWIKKRFWVPLASLLLIAAIVGGTVGALATRKDSSSDERSSTASTAALPSGPTSTAPSSSTPGPAQPSAKPFNSSLASIAWSDTSGTGYRRLYYQDSGGAIKESAWNSSDNEWYSSNDNLGNAKPNSPIAASVAGARIWPFQINLYYLNPSGQLVERYTKNGLSWSSGGLTNEDIIPSPVSHLATTWSQTDHTQGNNTGQQTVLLAYQDSYNKIWVVNATGPDPKLTQLEAAPKRGTGLAFQSVWHREGSPGLRLYYPKGDGLFTIDYEDAYGARQVPDDRAWSWTSHEDSQIGNISSVMSSGAGIASFSSGDDPRTGDPLFQYILTSYSRGVLVTSLDGLNAAKGWRTMARVLMGNVQAFSPLAANADRHVYAIEDGTVKEFVVSTDGLTWSRVGDVPTKN